MSKLTKAQRFWSKVATATLDDCWEWLGYRDRNGYGRFNVGREVKHRAEWAHRVALWLYSGERPSGVVMHTCDNPACCNPRHLKIGTIADNNEDTRRKGRVVNPLGNINRSKQQCKRGHDAFVRRHNSNRRYCPICNSMSPKERRATDAMRAPRLHPIERQAHERVYGAD